MVNVLQNVAEEILYIYFHAFTLIVYQTLKSYF